MPRTGRGGARQGTIGQAYGNRTDLNASMPVQTATGQDYGQAAAQQAAQRAIPVAAQPVPGAQQGSPAQGAGPLPQPAQPAPTTVNEQMAQQQQVYPGELKWDHPTDYPNEPITSGIPMGEGPGPEALVGFRPNVSNLLGGLASARGSSGALLDLASAARNLGI